MKTTILLFLVGALLMIGCAPVVTSSLTPDIAKIPFPVEANEVFDLSFGKDIDLNSGITMERGNPLLPSQINNITFAVFNHTNESIAFSNQGFDLSVFSYNSIDNNWEKLQLNHNPYPEITILPPLLEEWDFEIGNTWNILEDDAMALGRDQIRLLVSGVGKETGKTYGAYLDVTISLSSP